MTDNSKSEVVIPFLSNNMRLVLKHHPELASEYVNPDSEYYDCPNGIAYRSALSISKESRL